MAAEKAQAEAQQDVLSLSWAFGFSRDVAVQNLCDDNRSAIFFVSAHTGVIYDLTSKTQQLLQGERRRYAALVPLQHLGKQDALERFRARHAELFPTVRRELRERVPVLVALLLNFRKFLTNVKEERGVNFVVLLKFRKFTLRLPDDA